MRDTGRIRARDGWLVGLVVAGIVAVSFAAHGGPIHYSQPARRAGTGVLKPPPVKPQEVQDTNQRPHPSHWHLPIHLPLHLLSVLGLLGLTVLVLLLIAFLIKVVPSFGMGRRQRRSEQQVSYAPADVNRLTDQVSATFDSALAGLRRGDREQAIINCWLRLEQLADSAGFAPQSWQTSSELVSQWRQVLPLRERPLTQLAELYREARYSNHQMSADSVERARQALAGLRADLADRLIDADQLPADDQVSRASDG